MAAALSGQVATPDAVAAWLEGLQRRIVEGLQAQEPTARFVPDAWTSALGRGVTVAIAGGGVLEKACVNLSAVGAAALPQAATASRPHLAGRPWAACGVSVVVHPRNPLVPASHMNVRHFCCAGNDGGDGAFGGKADDSGNGAPDSETGDSGNDTPGNGGGGGLVQWFGGGYDLTPSYPNEADARHWHRTAKAALDPLNPALYPAFKRRCDQYFALPHRDEMRGVGGVFFDDFLERDAAHSLAVARAVGESYLPAYLPLLAAHASRPWTEAQRQWQLLRRGRYAEFNLALDRGTKFGLQSGGRTESILASLPPLARWSYGERPAPGSPEAALAAHLQPRDWAAGAG